eukprot:10800720-Prorocentrum_lima.AAC.1
MRAPPVTIERSERKLHERRCHNKEPSMPDFSIADPGIGLRTLWVAIFGMPCASQSSTAY